MRTGWGRPGKGLVVSRRKCGNCRFFQEAEFAGSGWCLNPLRRESSDAKVMVRRGELACRNGWDEDLFEPKRADGGVIPLMLHPVRREPPATPSEIDAVINARSESSESEAKDVVLDHIVVGEVPTPSDVDNRPTLQSNDTRTAILKAREKFRASGATRRRSAEMATSAV